MTAKRSKTARRTRSSAWPPEARVDALVAATAPLLELFSVLDAVFTEDDALTEHRQTSLGRCYEAWRKARAELDPNWDGKHHPDYPLSGRGRVGRRTGRVFPAAR
jgi:hypothetical protein